MSLCFGLPSDLSPPFPLFVCFTLRICAILWCKNLACSAHAWSKTIHICFTPGVRYRSLLGADAVIFTCLASCMEPQICNTTRAQPVHQLILAYHRYISNTIYCPIGSFLIKILQKKMREIYTNYIPSEV